MWPTPGKRFWDTLWTADHREKRRGKRRHDEQRELRSQTGTEDGGGGVGRRRAQALQAKNRRPGVADGLFPTTYGLHPLRTPPAEDESAQGTLQTFSSTALDSSCPGIRKEGREFPPAPTREKEAHRLSPDDRRAQLPTDLLLCSR